MQRTILREVASAAASSSRARPAAASRGRSAAATQAKGQAQAKAVTAQTLPNGPQQLTAHLKTSSLPPALHAAFRNVPSVTSAELVRGAVEEEIVEEPRIGRRRAPERNRGLTPPSSESSIRHKTLFDHLAALPNSGIGTKVRQVRWDQKGLDVPLLQPLMGPRRKLPPSKAGAQGKEADHECYWLITDARIRRAESDGRPHGKAYGQLYWRGKLATEGAKPALIRGSLKYAWDAAR